MTSDTEWSDACARLGLEPAPPMSPPDWFVPVSVHEGHAYTSGNVAFGSTGELLAKGRVGDQVDLPTAVECARQCAVNLLAVLDRSLGGLERVERILKVTVFVASAPGFTQQPVVADGASHLLAEVLGDRGAHSRSAVGVAELPVGTPVEVELIAAVRQTTA